MEVSLNLFLHVCLLTFLAIGENFAKKQESVKIIVEYKPDDCSETAADGDVISVHYTGTLDSGVIFDSSVQQKRDPITFQLGSHQVIPGWEQGLQGMCVGEKRKLIIPPHLAYGEKGHPPVIPSDATLTFTTEMMRIQKKSSEETILKTVQFLAMPALIAYVVYYLYDKYRKETASATTTKPDKKTKKRK